jgi:hypothetical protein
MHPLLAGLHLPTDKVQCHRWPVKPVPIKHPEQLFNLHHFSAGLPHRPALLLLQDLSDITGNK